MTDLRYALRQLVKRPGFSLVVILTLALGIGANTAMFSVIHGVLLRPLPFPQSDRLATVWLTYPHWREREVLRQFWDAIPVSYPEYQRLRDGAEAYEAVSIYRTDPMALAGEDGAHQVTVGSADDALLTVLGVTPAIGRWFSRTEALPEGPRLVVATHAFWRARLGGDSAALGRVVRLNDEAYTVIGILPEGLRFSRPNQPAAPDLWISVGALRFSFDENNHVFHVAARLRPGATFEQAEAETAIVLRGDRSPETRGARVVSRKEQEVAGVRPLLRVLWGVAGLMLLIACVNVASLLLGRTIERDRELAVRHALGADHRRLARQLLVESLVLALAGGGAGALAAWLGTGALTSVLPNDLPRLHEVRVDMPVLAFSLGVTLLTGVLFGVLPALLAGARAARNRLREGVRHLTAGGSLQRGLVAVQVALALVLLVGAGLFTRTLAELWTVDTGFRRDRLLTFELQLPTTRYAAEADVDAFYARLTDRLAALPGVVAVATTSVLPLSGDTESSSIWPASYGPEEGPKPEVERRIVTPGYLPALGVPLVRGRFLAPSDDAAAEPVMLVSRTAAARLWERGDPIGDRVEWNERWWTVVGVVEDVRDHAPGVAPTPSIYLPAAQAPAWARNIVLRTAGPPLTVAAGVRSVVRTLDPAVPVTNLRTMEQVAAAAVAAERFRALLVGGFALLAALLAAVGLYGVMSHGVAQRAREIGVRMALGAERHRVLRLVLRQAAATTAVGLVAGLTMAVPSSRIVDAFLFGVRPVDPVTYGGTVALLAVVASTAAIVPAWRATRVDPMEALRHD